MIMQPYFYIVYHRQILEQSNILEGSCNSCLIDFDGLFTGNILSIQRNNTLCGLIYTCQKVEYGGLTCTVGTDQSVQGTFFNLNIEIIYRTKSAERNA